MKGQGQLVIGIVIIAFLLLGAVIFVFSGLIGKQTPTATISLDKPSIFVNSDSSTEIVTATVKRTDALSKDEQFEINITEVDFDSTADVQILDRYGQPQNNSWTSENLTLDTTDTLPFKVHAGKVLGTGTTYHIRLDLFWNDTLLGTQTLAVTTKPV